MNQPKEGWEVEKIAENLHIWYLEATKELRPESYNPNAQKSYADLTEEQKQIDRHIAEKILADRLQTEQRVARKAVDHFQYLINLSEGEGMMIPPSTLKIRLDQFKHHYNINE